MAARCSTLRGAPPCGERPGVPGLPAVQELREVRGAPVPYLAQPCPEVLLRAQQDLRGGSRPRGGLKP